MKLGKYGKVVRKEILKRGGSYREEKKRPHGSLPDGSRLHLTEEKGGKRKGE